MVCFCRITSYNVCYTKLLRSFHAGCPDLEVIFCAAREDDPAVGIVRRVIDEHPGVDARLLIGDERVSGNPKLNNLVKGWAAARHPWIVMIDSNVLLPRGYGAELFAACRITSYNVCYTKLLRVWMLYGRHRNRHYSKLLHEQ